MALGDLGLALSVTDTVRARARCRAEATATFTGSADAVARLLTGRLTPRWTPDAVTVSGNVDLDDLRRVFPGF